MRAYSISCKGFDHSNVCLSPVYESCENYLQEGDHFFLYYHILNIKLQTKGKIQAHGQDKQAERTGKACQFVDLCSISPGMVETSMGISWALVPRPLQRIRHACFSLVRSSWKHKVKAIVIKIGDETLGDCAAHSFTS